ASAPCNGNSRTISAMAGISWNNLPVDEKKLWAELAKAARAEHARRYPGYKLTVARPHTEKERRQKKRKQVKQKDRRRRKDQRKQKDRVEQEDRDLDVSLSRDYDPQAQEVMHLVHGVEDSSSPNY
ncbi:hypothetical protein V5O48_019698, partial [Marasmius crinis-equi]